MAVAPISDDLLRRARRYDRRAIEAILCGAYPAVFRIARALTGQSGAARAVGGRVIRRGARVLPTWRPGAFPENWFYHHTLLATRESTTPPPALPDDPLIVDAQTDGPAYLAFVRALRHLPQQQREAFILHQGERLNERLLGVAMDCSADAAAVHLRGANTALASTIGADFPTLTMQMARAYSRLTPDNADIAAAIAPVVRKAVRARRLQWVVRMVVCLVLLAALGLLAYAGWRYNRGR
jgi:DNA-directed RNA polymerase specialized sigma24 family protein